VRAGARRAGVCISCTWAGTALSSRALRGSPALSFSRNARPTAGAVRISSGPTAGVLQPSKADAPVSKSEEPVFKPLADEEVVAAPSGSLSDFLGSAPPATEAPAATPSEEEASSSSGGGSSSGGQQPDEGVPATGPLAASSDDGQSRGGNPFA